MSDLHTSPTFSLRSTPEMPSSDASSAMTLVEKLEPTGRESPRKRSPGRKAVLLLTSSEYGCSNVILAVASELILAQKYDIHIASFKPLHHRIKQLNKSIPKNGSPVTFHLVAGSSALEALSTKNEFIGPFTPGMKGARSTYKVTLPALLNTWEGPEYVTGYKSCLKIICAVNPDIVVVEPLMSQGLEACEKLGNKCVILSPNTFHDLFRQEQPLLTRLLKIPAISSAFPYPLPWSRVPANLYLSFQSKWSLEKSSKVKNLKKFRTSNDLPPLPSSFQIYNGKRHFLVPSIPETDYPCHIPPNVTPCGPITLPEASVSKLDPDLFAWLKRGPTVLVNLGSQIVIDDAMAGEIAFGLKILLHRIPGIQVLWKLKTKNGRGVSSNQNPSSGFKGMTLRGDSVGAISKEIVDGRVRIVEWLAVGPLAVLKTGNVMCSVHHGGTNSFQEALSAGVPQVVLPNWLTTIDNANRVEWLGVGVYGSRSAAPSVEGGELFRSIMRVLGEGEQAVGVRQRARELALTCSRYGGRKRACEKIIEILEGQSYFRS